MAKADPPKTLLLKKDRRHFDDLARRLSHRKGRGCLFFLTADSPLLVDELVNGIVDAVAGLFEVKRCRYGTAHWLLEKLPKYQEDHPQLNVFADYPYEDAAKDPKRNWQRKLAEGLNVEREQIPNRKLHCLFILPYAVENIIALEAPDFYHFKDHSYHFGDDLVVLEEEKKAVLDLDTRNRIIELEHKKNQSRDFIHKANVFMDLAKVHMSAKQQRLAMEHLKKAEQLYQRRSYEEGLLRVYIELAEQTTTQGLYSQGLAFAKRVLDLGEQRHDLGAIATGCYLMAQGKMGLCLYREAFELIKRAEPILSKTSFEEILHIGISVQCGEISLALGYCLGGERHLDLAYSGLLETCIQGTAGFVHQLTCLSHYYSGDIDGIVEMGKDLSLKAKWVRQYFLCLAYILRGEWEMADRMILLLLTKAMVWHEALDLKSMIAFSHQKRMDYRSGLLIVEEALGQVQNKEAPHYIKPVQARRAELLRLSRHADAERTHRDLLAGWGEGPVFERAQLHRGLGFIYLDSDRLEEAEAQAQAALTICQTSGYRLSEGETLMLSAAVLGRLSRWQEAYELLKTALEKVRDRDIPLEAHVLEQLGDAAGQIGNARATVYHQKALALYQTLDLPCAEPLAARLSAEGKAGT